MELPDIWTALGIVLAFVGLGAAMLAVPAANRIEFWIARACFGCAYLIFLAKLAMWGATGPNLTKTAVVAAAGAVLSVATMFSLFWINGKQKAVVKAEAPPIEVRSTTDQLTASSRRLQNISNIQLRDAVIAFAARMREFELNTDLRDFPTFQPRGTPEETNRNAVTKQIMETSSRKQLEFSNTYLGEARELRDEIIFRLKAVGIFSPYVNLTIIEQFGPDVLDHGLTVGAKPILFAANYLEKLARRLPQP